MPTGKITPVKSLTGTVTSGGGTTDHSRLYNRDADDQHPISAITDLQDTLDEKLDSETALPLIEEAVKYKAKGLWYDALKTKATKAYWYLTSDIISSTGQGDPSTIISGPYDLGQGGGGGGGITTVTVNQVDWPSAVVVSGSNQITVNWTSVKGEEKTPTGNGSLYLIINGTQVEVKTNQAQGNVTFDITGRLIAGDNTIQVKALDAYGTVGITVGVINAITVELKSNFNYKLAYPVSGSTGINYTYIPYGDVTKVVHFIIDGIQYGVQTVTSTGEQQTFHINALTHGSHTLKVYFTTEVGGSVVTSNSLFYDLIYHVEGDATPIIASEFNDLEQEQYIAFNIPYRVYIENKNIFDIDYYVNDEFLQHLTVGSGEHYWEYRNDTPGTYKLAIVCGVTQKVFNVHIAESEIHIEPVTQDLKLALKTQGRSNSEPLEQRQKWEDTEHSVSCTLSDFNWSSDGWVKDSENNTILRVTGDARVTIPFKPFQNDFRTSGKTIELEIATSTVRDYSTKIISCFDDSRGFYVTPQIALFKSQQSELSTQYKEDDHVRLTFVVEKNTDNRIIWMYVNGIASGACQYPSDDSFRQLDPQNITIGSNDATIDIYNIRIYDNNLTSRQVVNNWIADTQDGSLKATRYYRNDNYNDKNEIVISKLPSTLPYMIWDIDPLPEYKGDKRLGNVKYIEPLDTTRNFTSTDATYNVQGTSSAVYPVKNIRIKYKKNKDFPQSNFTWVDDNGDTISSFKITNTDGGIGDNYFTYKVDFASSEGANNVELTKLYNDASIDIGILNPPQQLNNNVRVGIDGYPIVAFHKDADGNETFCTKANFNNDKANEAVYGFIGAYNSDNTVWVGDESWEITNNTSDLAKFKVPATAENFEAAFEIRFPDEDGYNKMDKLTPMTTWVSSTYQEAATGELLTEPVTFTYTETVRSEDGSYSKVTKSESFTNDTARYRLIKFKAELKDWFNVDSTLFYYIFTHLYLMIDSRAKNAFPTYFKSRVDGDGGDRWFWLPYDMDTAIGIDNKGKLSFDYNLEDTDKIDGADVFNGQDSVMWNNVRMAFDGEIGEMYSKLRTQRLISYDETESRFEQHQEQWSENIFNEDSKIKYITPLASGDNYLEMLQGGKIEQRKWWLYNRFKYMDSKYTAGDAKSDFIQFRAYVESGVEKPDITITPYADIYATVSYANGAAGTKQKRATRNVPIVIENPFTTEEAETDQETYIYSASQLKSIGDISGFKPDTVKVGNAIKLQELKVGSGAVGYTNPHLTELTLGSNTLLQLLDVRNCTNLSQAIDISACTNIEKVYFDGTKITGINLPDGGVLNTLHLPETLTKLTLKNQPLLTDLVLAGTENIESLWLENIPSSSIDAYEIISEMKEQSAVRLIGINETYDSVTKIRNLYDRLDTMKGLDAEGEVVAKAQVTGTINIQQISYADYTELSARYAEVVINAAQIICTVNFWNESTLFNSQSIVKGQAATDPGTPHKASTAQYYYEFDKWDKDFSNIQTDLDIYAEFISYTQIYTIKFDPQTQLVDPIPDQQVEYNNLVVKPTDPYIEGAVFDGWFKEAETINQFDFTVPMTGPFIPDEDDKPQPITLYGKWTDQYSPVVTTTIVDYNKFTFTIKDNIAVTAYAITNSATEPTEWIEISPTSEFTSEKTITTSGIYYVWGKDAASHTGNKAVNAYELTKDPAAGTDAIIIKYQDTILTDFVLENREVNIHVDIDSHYENLVIKLNDTEILNDSSHIIISDSTIKTICTPKSYTVNFEMVKAGAEQEPTQIIVYNNLVDTPSAQYIVEGEAGSQIGYVIDHWINTATLETWNFNTDTVSEDIILRAVWIEYHDPTRVTVAVQDNQVVTCNFTQTVSEGVTVNWGDSSETYTSTDYGPDTRITFSHTYLNHGTYYVSFTCNKGIMKLGYNIDNQAVSPASVITRIQFSYDITSTNNYAFKGAVELESASLTDYMTEVSLGAFQDCGFTSLNIPRKITELKKGCFQGCSRLTNISIEDNITSIGEDVFRNCTALTNVHLADTITDIGQYCFYGCTALTTINIPINLTKFSDYLFADSGLKEIDIPETIVELGNDVFVACSNLESVKLRNKDLIIGTTVFRNCSKLKTAGPIGGNYNIEFAWDTKLPMYALQGGYLQSYLEEVTLPNTIKEIGDYAFRYCGSLKSINIPLSLEKLGISVFEWCNNLPGTISIPFSCQYIGQNAFTRCSALSRVDLHNTTSSYKVETYLASWFLGCAGGLILHIPKEIEPAEQSRNVYGQCWNFKDDGIELTYYNDLD